MSHLSGQSQWPGSSQRLHLRVPDVNLAAVTVSLAPVSHWPMADGSVSGCRDSDALETEGGPEGAHSLPPSLALLSSRVGLAATYGPHPHGSSSLTFRPFPRGRLPWGNNVKEWPLAVQARWRQEAATAAQIAAAEEALRQRGEAAAAKAAEAERAWVVEQARAQARHEELLLLQTEVRSGFCPLTSVLHTPSAVRCPLSSFASASLFAPQAALYPLSSVLQHPAGCVRFSLSCFLLTCRLCLQMGAVAR